MRALQRVPVPGTGSRPHPPSRAVVPWRRVAWYVVVAGTASLAACGGGGGGSSTGSPTTGASDAPTPVKSLALADVPAAQLGSVLPANFKAVTLERDALITGQEQARTTQATERMFVEVWYLDRDRQRQTLALMTLAQLDAMRGRLRLTAVPSGVASLGTEIYTLQGNVALTLATREIAV